MRSISQQAVIAAYRDSSGSIFLPLLTIEEASLSEPIRIVNNTRSIESNGETFEAFPFAVILPLDDGQSLHSLELKIDNVSQEIISILRALSAPPVVSLRVVLAESPDVVEMEVTNMVVREIEADALTISFTVANDDWLNSSWPGLKYDMSHFRGLFR